MDSRLGGDVTDGEDVLIAGRYRLVTALASGGMGVVWKGWDERLHREVAIKQLRVQPGLRPAEATTARDRAMREARNTARLHHPHAVPVYDVVEQDGEPCLIMEFLPCISLQESIKQRGTLPPAEVARIGAEVAQALSAAHKAGIVHRDVKPGNVLLAEDGTTKLTDFGISHALGDVALTATGMLTGTPAYLAPEVARGQPANFASDVFSLGATLYSASEGTPPFGEDVNAMAVLHRVASGQFRKPQRSGPLTPLLEELLAGDPDTRPSMPQVARTLTLVHAQNSAAETAGSKSASSLETAQYTQPQRRPAPEPSPPV
ncbi:MAG: serine/threonine-protein kinase, partial [Pseudonocardiales bacterium]